MQCLGSPCRNDNSFRSLSPTSCSSFKNCLQTPGEAFSPQVAAVSNTAFKLLEKPFPHKLLQFPRLPSNSWRSLFPTSCCSFQHCLQTPGEAFSPQVAAVSNTAFKLLEKPFPHKLRQLPTLPSNSWRSLFPTSCCSFQHCLQTPGEAFPPQVAAVSNTAFKLVEKPFPHRLVQFPTLPSNTWRSLSSQVAAVSNTAFKLLEKPFLTSCYSFQHCLQTPGEVMYNTTNKESDINVVR